METIKIGDKLLATNNKPLKGNDVAPSLIVGGEYPAKQIYVCKCGQDHIDVGLKSKYNWITCYKCREELPDGAKIHWCHPIRFEIVK